jgi:hypothetical protein
MSGKHITQKLQIGNKKTIKNDIKATKFDRCITEFLEKQTFKENEKEIISLYRIY